MKTAKPIFVLGLIGFVAWWVLSTPRLDYDPVVYARREAEAQRIAQAAQLEAQWAPARAAAINLALIAFLGTGVLGLLSFGGAAFLRFVNERRPDQRGVLPVAATDLRRLSPAALAEYHRSEQARAAIAPVPHTVTYSPHYSSRNEGGALAPEAEAAPLALPGITDLAAISHTPTRDSILLGLAPGGALVTVPAAALCHVALCGATGGGKSNIMRLLLPQLQAWGAKVVLADPHYTDLDAENGDDWTAIRHRLTIEPARTPKKIDALLTLLTHELEQRLDRRARGVKVGGELFFALDELPVITNEVKGASDRLAKLLREGRKVGLYVIGASQDFLIKTIGGTSGARDCYRTAFYLGGDLVSARALLDLPQREINEGALQTGMAYLRSKATPHAELVRVPLASNHAITRILEARTTYEPPREPPGISHPDALNPKAAQVREALAQKTSMNQIIKQVWGVENKGAEWQRAANELRDVIAEIVRAA